MAEIEEANANADPTNTATARSVSEDYIKIGDELLKLGNRTDAPNGYLKALQIRERIAATNPESAGAQVVSANFYESPGNCYFLPDVKQAKIRYKQSLVIRQELQFNNTILASDAKKSDEVCQKIEKCDAKLK